MQKSRKNRYEPPATPDLPNRERLQQSSQPTLVGHDSHSVLLCEGRANEIKRLIEYASSTKVSVVKLSGASGSGRSALLSNFAFECHVSGKKVVYIRSEDWESTGPSGSALLSKLASGLSTSSRAISCPDDHTELAAIVSGLKNTSAVAIIDSHLFLQRMTNPAHFQILINRLSQGPLAEGSLVIFSVDRGATGFELQNYSRTLELQEMSLQDACKLLRQGLQELDEQTASVLVRRLNLLPGPILSIRRRLQSEGIGGAVDLIGRIDKLKQETLWETGDLQALESDLQMSDNRQRIVLRILSQAEEPVLLDDLTNIASSIAGQAVDASRVDVYALNRILKLSGAEIESIPNLGLRLVPEQFKARLSRSLKQNDRNSYKQINNFLSEAYIYLLRKRQPSDSDMLAELLPAYRAARYRIAAGDLSNALAIYISHICRFRKFHSQKVVGAFSDDLELLSAIETASKELDAEEALTAFESSWIKRVLSYLLQGLLLCEEAVRTRESALEYERQITLLSAQDWGHLSLSYLFMLGLENAKLASCTAVKHLAAKSNDNSIAPDKWAALYDLDRREVESLVYARKLLVSYFAETENVSDSASEHDFTRLRASDLFFSLLVALDGFCRDGHFDKECRSSDMVSLCQLKEVSGESPYQGAFRCLSAALINWRVKDLVDKAIQDCERALCFSKASGRGDLVWWSVLLSWWVSLDQGRRKDVREDMIIKRIQNLKEEGGGLISSSTQAPFFVEVYYVLDLCTALFFKGRYTSYYTKQELQTQSWTWARWCHTIRRWEALGAEKENGI